MTQDEADTRIRIIAAATKLIAEGGRDALTTRAVSAAAGVQAPTIYRLFGDKTGLLDAVAEHGFATYMREKTQRGFEADPIADLRAGWDLHIAFGLANPAIHSIIIEPRRKSPAVAAGEALLRARIHRVAVAGQLRVSEARAAGLMHAAGTGTVIALLEQPPDRRDLGLSETAREAVIAAITTEAVITTPGPAAAAIALRAVLADARVLTAGERHLLAELLERLASS